MTTNWEQQYLEDDTPWDKGSAAPPLIEWMDRNPDLISGRILVPGCGLGHDVRALATLKQNVEPIGVDISLTALEKARSIQHVGIESYLVADLFTMENAHTEAYDWVWEHTCFCAIDPSMRDKYVEAVHKILKPDGHFLGVFYLDPYDDEHPPGSGPPHGSSIRELETRFVESGKFEILECYVPDKSYPGREGLEQIIRFAKK